MSGSRDSKLVNFGYCLAVTVWLASLLLPAAEVNGTMRIPGFRAFLIGIDAIGEGIVGWLANPFALGALVAGFFGRYPTATVLAALACLLAVSSFFAPGMARADGLPITDVEFESGFFLWLAAFSLILATSAFASLRAR